MHVIEWDMDSEARRTALHSAKFCILALVGRHVVRLVSVGDVGGSRWLRVSADKAFAREICSFRVATSCRSAVIVDASSIVLATALSTCC